MADFEGYNMNIKMSDFEGYNMNNSKGDADICAYLNLTKLKFATKIQFYNFDALDANLTLIEHAFSPFVHQIMIAKCAYQAQLALVKVGSISYFCIIQISSILKYMYMLYNSKITKGYVYLSSSK